MNWVKLTAVAQRDRKIWLNLEQIVSMERGYDLDEKTDMTIVLHLHGSEFWVKETPEEILEAGAGFPNAESMPF